LSKLQAESGVARDAYQGAVRKGQTTSQESGAARGNHPTISWPMKALARGSCCKSVPGEEVKEEDTLWPIDQT
jgi:hypothetical protein